MTIYSTKSRGQRGKYKTLLGWLNKMEPYKDMNNAFECFRVPTGPWLARPKTYGKVKTSFCKEWIKKTEEFIAQKPKDLPFCKVVAAITYPNIRLSEIIIFYEEWYYKSFWDRKGPYQIWTPMNNDYSFAKARGIVTELSEIGYIEELNDEDYNIKSQIWFYGEFPYES